MKTLLSLLVLLNGVDAYLTYLLVTANDAREGNALVVFLADRPVFIAVKIIVSLACALILMDAYRHQKALTLVVTIILVMAYFFIVSWNGALYAGILW